MTPYFHYALQRIDFSVDEQHQLLRKACPGSGAIVTFTGLVRDSINCDTTINHDTTIKHDTNISDDNSKQSPFFSSFNRKGNVLNIEISTYEAMSKKQMQQIGYNAFQKFDIQGLSIIHRFGKLEPHEQIVFVAAASKHRVEAFLAAQMTMDFLKSSVAFWKKENYTDSADGLKSRWIEPTNVDQNASKKWLE